MTPFQCRFKTCIDVCCYSNMLLNVRRVLALALTRFSICTKRYYLHSCRFSGTWKLVQILETPTKTKMGKSGTDRNVATSHPTLIVTALGLLRETIVCAWLDAEFSLKPLAFTGIWSFLSDRMRRDELAAISGPNEFAEFYNRLKQIKEFHRKHPHEVDNLSN